MVLKELIKISSQHGGSWFHIKQGLLEEGASIEFAEQFLVFLRSELNKKHSDCCVELYDAFVEYGEEYVKAWMLILT
ncbi:hypothetical protein [Vibrio alginolyticus]|uniref:hypothetical protein n=1 Tax=Vibrio alginolyticus TaxID=663 RepID=UPI0037545244